jgi:hypothetical protein
MSWTDTLKRFAGATSAAEQAVRTMQTELATAREAITAKREEHERARTALWPKAEMIATAERLVDEEGQRWGKDYRYAFLQRLAGRLSDVELRGGTTTFPSYAALPFSLLEPVPFGAECYFRPAAWKEAFRADITNADYEPGTPRADRPALLERLARELAELEAAEEAFVDKMAASGIVTPHRPEVQARRASEARAAVLAEQKRKDAEWLEQAKKDGRLGSPTIHHATMHPDRARDRR